MFYRQLGKNVVVKKQHLKISLSPLFFHFACSFVLDMNILIFITEKLSIAIDITHLFGPKNNRFTLLNITNLTYPNRLYKRKLVQCGRFPRRQVTANDMYKRTLYL